MAQPSPLRNRTLYGTRDGVALSQGDAEAWRASQARPVPPPSPSTAPAAPAAPVKPSALRTYGKWAGRFGGAGAAVGLEALRLGQIDAEQGEAARNAELPRSAGRLGGAWAGAKAGGALGAMTGPAAPYAAPAGAILGGAAGYAFGDDAVDAVAPRVTEAAGRMRYPSRDPKHYTDPAYQSTAADVAARPPDIKFRDESTPPASFYKNPAPIDIKFRDESTPPASFYKNPAPPAADAGQAARIDAPPEQVTAYGFQDANKAEAAGMRSAARIQDYGANARSNIVNGALGGYGGFMGGNVDELMRRMQNDLTSYQYKGFPSLRAARAEMWNNLINSANGVTAKGADNAAAADMQGMQDANVSQRAFSERKNKVDTFNVGTSEERRAGDLDRAVTREGNTLRALASGTSGSDKYSDPSYAGKLYEDYLKIYKDPAVAAQMANRGAVAAGDTADSPVMAMAQTADADNLQRGMRGFADRWFGFGNRAFDPKTAEPVAEADWTDSWLPGGVDSGDLKLRDANGNETWATRGSLPPGEDFTAFKQRLARQRELARLRNEGK